MKSWVSWYFFLLALVSVLGVLGMIACGGAHPDNGARAIEIPGPINTVCFAITNGQGVVVSGNCLWQK